MEEPMKKVRKVDAGWSPSYTRGPDVAVVVLCHLLSITIVVLEYGRWVGGKWFDRIDAGLQRVMAATR